MPACDGGTDVYANDDAFSALPQEPLHARADATYVDADAVLPREPPRAPCGDDVDGEPPPRVLPPARADACAFAGRLPVQQRALDAVRTDPLRCACPDDVASAFFSPFAFDCLLTCACDARPQRWMLLRLRALRAHDASSAQRDARNGPSRRAADACRRCASLCVSRVAAHRRRRHRQPQRSACRVVQRWRRGSSRGKGFWTGSHSRCPTGAGDDGISTHSAPKACAGVALVKIYSDNNA